MDINTLKKEIESLGSELKSAVGDRAEELKKAIDAVQAQADAIEIKIADRHSNSLGHGFDIPDLKGMLQDNDSIQRLLTDGKGTGIITLPSHMLERKTAITSGAVGSATSGVLQIDRTTGIVAEARQALTIRDVLSARPTNMQLVDFVKVNSPLTKASPQVEASAKFENAVTFTTVSAQVRTIATWIPASRQVLEDMDELASFLQGSLPYYVDLEEEEQILSGDNTGQNLNGLIPQATAFNTGLLPASFNYIDIVGRAASQLAIAKEMQPTFVILNPADWWEIRMTKDGDGRYILGDPMAPVSGLALFGLVPVPTTSIGSGQFLVGSGSPAAVEIRDRAETVVEISTSHSDYFTKNMIAIRAEKRLALITKRPASFIEGTFISSP